MSTITRTPRKIINRALRAVHAIDPDEGPSPEEEADAFETFNDMLANLSAQRLLGQFAIHKETFTVTAGTSEYSIGSGATWNTDRPHDIVGGFLRDSGSLDHPLDKMTRERWNLIYEKGLSERPRRFLYRRTYPNGTFYFDTAPAQADTAHLDLLKPLSSVATVTTTIVIPPEYVDLLVNNLAIRLAPEFSMPVPPEVGALAVETRETVKENNTEWTAIAVLDPMLTGNTHHRWFETT